MYPLLVGFHRVVRLVGLDTSWDLVVGREPGRSFSRTVV
jgi:hypothetical protein